MKKPSARAIFAVFAGRRSFLKGPMAFVVISLIAVACTSATSTPMPTAVPTPTAVPATLPPGPSTPVATLNQEYSVGAPSAQGWRWRLTLFNFAPGEGQEEPRSHPIFVLIYSLEGIHEVRIGDQVERYPPGQVVFIPAGVVHSHTVFPKGSGRRNLVVGLTFGVGAFPPLPPPALDIFVSPKPLDTKPDVRYVLKVQEQVFASGARRDNVLNTPATTYLVQGTVTQRVGESVLKQEAGTVWEPPEGVRFTTTNEGTAQARVLEFVLVPDLSAR